MLLHPGINTHDVPPAAAFVLQSAEGLRPPQLVCVRPSSSLREVLALLAQHRLHRLHVIDERQRPVGIVTITDLLRVIVGCNELLEALGPVSMLAFLSNLLLLLHVLVFVCVCLLWLFL
jgi:hypothetical protein